MNTGKCITGNTRPAPLLVKFENETLMYAKYFILVERISFRNPPLRQMRERERFMHQFSTTSIATSFLRLITSQGALYPM
jgi:hypothetical protein